MLKVKVEQVERLQPDVLLSSDSHVDVTVHPNPNDVVVNQANIEEVDPDTFPRDIDYGDADVNGGEFSVYEFEESQQSSSSLVIDGSCDVSDVATTDVLSEELVRF